jgi:LysM repeat protein
MPRPLAVVIALAALAGCASPGSRDADTAAPAAAAAKPAAATPAPGSGPGGGTATADAQPAAKPPTEPPKPEAPALTGPAARAEAQRLVRHAFELLDQGEEAQAKTDVEQALALEPDNRAAACLLKGITADPQQTLGAPSTPYTVRPGETLARIAQRALGDTCEFYILARYNQIRVPRQLPAGQVIRIPGTRALAGPEPAAPAKPAAPAVAKPAAPTPAEQSAAVNPAPAAPPKPPGPDPQIRAQVERHHRAAFAAFRKQDLATAIREWDRVLEIDPANDLARARRQEALELNRKLREMK